MRISDWSSDVCSADLIGRARGDLRGHVQPHQRRIGERGGEREAELAVLDHRAERGIVVAGDEIEFAAPPIFLWPAVADPDRADRAAFARQAAGDSQHRSEAHTSAPHSLMTHPHAALLLTKNTTN